MERTLNNGYTYYFYKIFDDYIVADCFYGGKWNRISRTFNSMDEVELWCNEINLIYGEMVSKNYV